MDLGLKDMMKTALMSARRISRPINDASTKTRRTKGPLETAFPPQVSFPSFGDIHFSEEEGDDEAILDKGASRTIIGSHRVEPLLKSLKGVKVKRGPSKCAFRFGNCGILWHASKP